MRIARGLAVALAVPVMFCVSNLILNHLWTARYLARLEQVLTVTPSALPPRQLTSTPIPGEARAAPSPYGSPVRYGDLEVTMLDVQHTQDNRLVIIVRTPDVGSPNGATTFSPYDFRLLGVKGKSYGYRTGSLRRERLFDGDLVEGTMIFAVEPDDAGFVLVWTVGLRKSLYLSLTPHDQNSSQ